MPDFIKEKRESLENFIREQMIGPGGCRYHFGIDGHEGEVLNTTPGSIYSTAVLFPEKYFQDDVETDNNDGAGNVDEDDADDLDETTDERNNVREEEEDQASLSRRFPNMMGLSFCLNSLEDLAQNLSVKIKCRYYQEVKRDEFDRLYVKITDHFDFFTVFFGENALINQNFILNGTKLYIRHQTQDSSEFLKRELREFDAHIAARLRDEFDLNNMRDVGNGNLFLLTLREHLFKNLNENRREYDRDVAARSIEQIKTVEQYEAALSYCNDLLEMYNSRSFGFWKELAIEHELDLSGIRIDNNRRKNVVMPADYPAFKDFISIPFEGDGENLKASLSICMQLISDFEQQRFYIKFLLQNTSSKFVESRQHFFFIVNGEVNKRSFFGTQILVESPYLEPYHINDLQESDDEEQNKLNYLYRSLKDYGIGHFCSVDWNAAEHCVWTEFMPVCDSPDVDSVPRNKNATFIEENGVRIPPPYLLPDNRCLELKWLSVFSDDVDDDQIRAGLLDFTNKYREWIDLLGEENEIAQQIVRSCRKDYERMRDNIEQILSSPANMRSFRLMNAAMFMQMWHGKRAEHARDVNIDLNFYKNCDDFLFAPNQHASWRPFQLAFILLNLDGIIRRPSDPQWRMRNELVDLVWFPTGGGKTEAYLGIIAMTIIHRRKTQGARGGGVTAIMRYTLRLLATQQFERATKLILAIEQLRRLYPGDIGTSKINIGLFVGKDSLPNDIGSPADRDNANTLCNEALKWMNNRESKIPLPRRCPWCSSELTWNNRVFKCRGVHCTFSNELPVELCDELVYENTPSLLFGTVDKFASLAHKVSCARGNNGHRSDSRRLFGRGDGIDFLTPDLIIQDELHLLQGPLGSAVGLYECAIDKLCCREENGIPVRPKIISSTATTRNTSLQIRALYDRDVSVFPKNGTDFDDSFFSFYKRTMNAGGDSVFLSKRRYLGIMPTGRTQMTIQMRLSAIFFVHRALFEKEHLADFGDEDFVKAADYYYSLISYFNSLREVGKTDAQFYLEFAKYTKRLFGRVLRNGDLLECYYAKDQLKEQNKAELTGRLSGAEVVNELKHVGEHWTPQQRNLRLPPDFILATNMISVGLDVSRFNAIIMNSMPRNIAEYIQASSRVARETQGLVITLHNPFRSRDVSHFEKFKEFHEKMYFYVEPISITPFSNKSIEHYFPLYLATIVRHLETPLAERTSAGVITEELANEIKEQILQDFTTRLTRAQNPHLNENEHQLFTQESLRCVTETLDSLIEEWLVKKNEHENLVYSDGSFGARRRPSLYVSMDAYEDVKENSAWLVPLSLRIIEPESVLKISPTWGNGR